MTNAADFSAIVAIAKTRQKVPWDMGDALGDLCGPPGAHGRRDGSREKIHSAIDAIVNTVGFCDYDDSTLARYRQVAWEFPEGIRRHGLAWSVHREVSTKERLAAAIGRCPPGAHLTRELIRKALVEIEADAQREREAAYEATRLASRKILDEEVCAEKAVLAAQTEEELAIADQQFAEAHRQAEIMRAQLAQPPTATAKAPRPAKAPPVESPAQVEEPTQPPVDNAVLQNAQRHISQQEAELRQAQGKLDAWNDGGGAVTSRWPERPIMQPTWSILNMISQSQGLWPPSLAAEHSRGEAWATELRHRLEAQFVPRVTLRGSFSAPG